jgi:hypothetical protein
VALPGVWMTASTLWAADTNAPPVVLAPLTPQQWFEGGADTYNNWIELGAGGFFEQGNQAQLQQRHQTPGGAFGGIEDFHYQKDLNKTTTLSADGRAVFDNDDYKLKLDLERDKVGYLKFSFNQFRTWSNGDGGFYPPSGAFYNFPSGDALALNRGTITFEGGLTIEDVPNITFKYTRDYREGEKSSTSWGAAHPALGVNQALSPSFYDIHEHSDSFQLDVTHEIKKTQFGAGLRYEFGTLNEALNISQYPGEPVAQKITDQQGTTYGIFSAHAFTETWFKTNLMFSTGYSYSDLDNHVSGSRIYGSDFDVGYVPGVLSGVGFTSLGGSSQEHEYVADLNLFYKPTPHLSIVPSIRVQKQDTVESAGGAETLGLNAAVPFASTGNNADLDVRERLDATYNGITNWVLYARGDWSEGSGNLSENGGLVPIAGIGTLPVQEQIEQNRLFQKYSTGARWYPLRSVTLDVGGYYKRDNYNYDNNIDSTANNSAITYPGFLILQDFETYDGNARLTLRPWQSVTLVSRYEYQWSTIQTQPDPISGLSSVQSSTMTSHILAQDVNWAPWSRLSLQLGVNYVRSETKTPASDVTQAILNAQNNYWTLNVSSDLILDDKTDLIASYFYYRADDYQDNSTAGVPYGAGGEENSVTATLVRRLTKNLRVSLKYGFFHDTDQLYGGNNNNTAQFVFTSLQYRF